MATLPIELVRQILGDIAMITLQKETHLAVRLQLVSHAAQTLLMPILFHTLLVRIPAATGDAPTSPSFEFFCRMLADKDAPPRPHIRHLVLRGPMLSPAVLNSVQLAAAGTRWLLESVFADHPQHISMLKICITASALIFTRCTGNIYLRLILVYALSNNSRKAHHGRFCTDQVNDSSICTAVRGFMGTHTGTRALHATRDEEPCTLYILVAWPTETHISEAERICNLSESVIELLGIPQLRLVLKLPQESEFERRMSAKLRVALQPGEMMGNRTGETAPSAQEWARLQVQSLVPKPATDRDLGHWIEEMMADRTGHVS